MLNMESVQAGEGDKRHGKRRDCSGVKASTVPTVSRSEGCAPGDRCTPRAARNFFHNPPAPRETSS